MTGSLNAMAHGLSWAIVWHTQWGHVLLKVTLVLAVLALAAAHGANYGRKLEQLARSAGTDAVAAVLRQRLQRHSVRLSAVNLGLNLAIVGLAAWLATLP